MSPVIVVTGPCGAGKTTVSTLLAERLNAPCLRGDDIKEELFPGLVDITEYPDKLAAVKAELLHRTKELFEDGKTVVVDYVVLGTYIEQFQSIFGDHLVFKVLLPRMDVLTNRDKSRDCWTAGEDHLNDLSTKFLRDKELIGKENFIDNSDESAEETLKNHFSDLL